MGFLLCLIQRKLSAYCLCGAFSSKATGPVTKDHGTEGRVAPRAKHGRVIARSIQALYGGPALVIDKDTPLMDGDPLLIESRDCVVLNDVGPDKLTVAVLGVRDLVVVATGDAVLVCPKSRSQDVKKIVEVLKEKGLTEFL